MVKIGKNRDPPSSLDVMLHYGEEHEIDREIAEYLENYPNFAENIHAILSFTVKKVRMSIYQSSILTGNVDLKPMSLMNILGNCPESVALILASMDYDHNCNFMSGYNLAEYVIERTMWDYPPLGKIIENHLYSCDSCLNRTIYAQKAINIMARMYEDDIIPEETSKQLFAFVAKDKWLHDRDMKKNNKRKIAGNALDFFWGYSDMDEDKWDQLGEYMIKDQRFHDNEESIQTFIKRQIKKSISNKASDNCPEYESLMSYINAVFKEGDPDQDYQYVDTHILECHNCMETAFYMAADFSGGQYNPFIYKLFQR